MPGEFNMPETEISAASPPDALSPDQIGLLLSLRLLDEMHAAMRPGAETGEILGRARDHLLNWRWLAEAAPTPGAVLDPALAATLLATLRILDRNAPILMRTAPPVMPPALPAE
jgi:hypothetical protein